MPGISRSPRREVRQHFSGPESAFAGVAFSEVAFDVSLGPASRAGASCGLWWRSDGLPRLRGPSPPRERMSSLSLMSLTWEKPDPRSSAVVVPARVTGRQAWFASIAGARLQLKHFFQCAAATDQQPHRLDFENGKRFASPGWRAGCFLWVDRALGWDARNTLAQGRPASVKNITNFLSEMHEKAGDWRGECCASVDILLGLCGISYRLAIN